MKVTVLVGGVGGARFLLGVQQLLGLGQFASASAPVGEHELTAVVNIGDDAWMHGVRICPDLDTCMYTLGGGVDPERGWGHRGETWHAKEELAQYGVQPDWFQLGDRDLATHLVRSQMLRAGYPLSQVTAALCDRWQTWSGDCGDGRHAGVSGEGVGDRGERVGAVLAGGGGVAPDGVPVAGGFVRSEPARGFLLGRHGIVLSTRVRH